MPVTLDPERPSLVRIRHRAGVQLGTIVVVADGHAWEAPVAFGAYRVVPDYRRLAAAALDRACPEGALVRALPSGSGCGREAELPVVEVLISPAGDTIGEELVRRGWAVPDPEALAHHRHADAYWQALREARAGANGIWGEAGVDACALGIPDEQARATAPSPHPPPGWHAAGMLVLVAALVLVAMRRVRLRAAPSLPRRGGMVGGALRLAAIGIGLVRGALPPRASASAPATAPAAPADPARLRAGAATGGP